MFKKMLDDGAHTYPLLDPGACTYPLHTMNDLVFTQEFTKTAHTNTQFQKKNVDIIWEGISFVDTEKLRCIGCP
jgi:hypothetical protein